MRSGRKFSSNDLQLIILAQLEKGSAHGYELIKSLDELSDGYYVPSPGMIYPSLTFLEEIGHADVETEGNRKRYTLTASGRNHLAQNRAQVDAILTDLAQIGSRMEETRRAFAGDTDSGENLEGQSDALRSVRHDLKTFLRSYTPPNREEDGRIARIIRGAVSEMRGEPQSPLDPDALLRLMMERRSMGLSRLKPDAIDCALIERMLEAANWAPSHKDTEPWRFTVFTGDGRERLAELFESAQREDLENGVPTKGKDGGGARKRAFAAPLWISIGMTPGLREDGSSVVSEDEELMAVASAVQNLHLMAQASGLAGMWHSKGISVHPAVARGLGLEPPSRLLGFFMCGWPAGDWLTAERRPLDEKLTWQEGGLNSPEKG